MPTTDDLLQGLLSVGDYARYGMSPEDKHKANIAALGNIDPRVGVRESDLTNAERLASSGISSYRLGTLANPLIGASTPIAANLLREGSQGIGAVLSGKPFFTPGGYAADDPTPSDDSANSGFNLREFNTAAQGAIGGAVRSSPALRLLSGLFKR